MSYIKLFKELNKKDSDIAGGKGASLGEMINLGIAVPDGFVILADTFEQFIKDTDLIQEIDAILGDVDHNVIHTVDNASEKIQGLIKNAVMPQPIIDEVLSSFKKLDTEFVAVRSSATAEDGIDHAWAGQLDSYLNITENDILEKVQDCWASLFTPRAIFYRFEKGLDTTKISVAVVIQKMVNSELSGIAFSVHPVTEDRNQLIIEAGLGLGEAIVSGSIIPDAYVVEKEPRNILDINVAEQGRGLFRKEDGGNKWVDLNEKGKEQVLNEEQIQELSDLVIEIENHYGHPQDIEWAFEDGKFYIVQSRPITTLGIKAKDKKQFNKNDYLLSFWVQGVSVFVTDIHLGVYDRLEVLYIIDNGVFKQYFTKKAYQKALNDGLVFYSDKNAFDEYKEDLVSHIENFKAFFKKDVESEKELSKEDLSKFFKYTEKLCGDYAKMNFEFTDKAFQHQDENSVIKGNLEKVSKFKDEVREVMNQVLFEENGFVNQVFKIIGGQFKISQSVLHNLTQEEILYLYSNQRPDEKKVLKRQDAFVEDYRGGVFEGSTAENIIKEFEEKATYSDELRGQVANKGRIIGIVKIIPVDYSDSNRVNDEIKKMKQGDILVAETTAPELIVACKKAGAIVTDMGGLMSHAAIVSREFGIPCIVGTKNASKVLKDGMEVEVDADNGVVKIL